MRELTLDELFFVSGGKQATPKGGGATSAGDKSGSGYGDTSLPQPSKINWGQLIGGAFGGALGSVAGPGGATVGTIAGTYYGNEMENAWNGTEPYQTMGEEYKDDVHQQLQDGLFHND